MLTDPADALPEFLVQYKYVRTANAASAAAPASIAPADSWLVNCDLSTPLANSGDAGVGRAAEIVATNDAEEGSGSIPLVVKSISMSPLVPDIQSGLAPTSSRSKLVRTNEAGLQWAAISQNGEAQRAAASAAGRGSIGKIWQRMNFRVKRDLVLQSLLHSGAHAARISSDAAGITAIDASVSALQDSVVSAQRELAIQREARMQAERELFAQSRKQR